MHLTECQCSGIKTQLDHPTTPTPLIGPTRTLTLHILTNPTFLMAMFSEIVFYLASAAESPPSLSL